MITFGHVTTLATGILLLSASASLSQTTPCAPRAAMVEHLATAYGEKPQSMGLGSGGQVMEVFASPQSGSWTITVTTPNGITCLVASGQSFEPLAQAVQPPGSDA